MDNDQNSPPFDLVLPKAWTVPLIISTPHVGTELPPEIAAVLRTEIAQTLPDTDWFVDELYEFAHELGAPLIRARYSRYVIDLNRPIEGPSLYQDQRRQTDVIPRTSFDGDPLYHESFTLSEAERERRIEVYYRPYYAALDSLLKEALARFGKVLLWDGHSIKRDVPSIQPQPFVDLMLGDRDGTAAHPKLVEAALISLQSSPYSVAYNAPFKGGQITRHHGHIREGVYAMQLEKSQDIYMTAGAMDSHKKQKLQSTLRQTFTTLLRQMESL